MLIMFAYFSTFNSHTNENERILGTQRGISNRKGSSINAKKESWRNYFERYKLQVDDDSSLYNLWYENYTQVLMYLCLWQGPMWRNTIETCLT